jgi:3-phenylpropionate/trans-cinnamate dioxygenase ferredoxin subunit
MRVMDSSFQDQNFEYLTVGPSSDLGEGDRLKLQLDGCPYLLFRVDGKLYAISGTCSHEDEPLDDGELDGYEIICPRHGARFDLRSGGAKSLPAVIGIQTFPVREQNGQIEIGLPK